MIRFLISLFIISNSFLIANLKAESWSSQQSLNIDGTFNPYDYGAKGDGKSIDTKAIQATIDQCHQEGGGIVNLQNGIFISGTIILKSNVHLYVESGAVLKESNSKITTP
jgi:polygalacturonase